MPHNGMIEEIWDAPGDIDFFNGPVKYFCPEGPFEVDGIVYTPPWSIDDPPPVYYQLMFETKRDYWE